MIDRNALGFSKKSAVYSWGHHLYFIFLIKQNIGTQLTDSNPLISSVKPQVNFRILFCCLKENGFLESLKRNKP